MDRSRQRGIIVLAFVGIIALAIAVWLMIGVQQNLEPSDDASSIDETSKGLPELKQEVVADGLSHVWDVGFLPDETPVFTERAGTISKWSDGQKTVLLTVPHIVAMGEGGLMGLVVDPDFDQNRFIYACYNTDQDIQVSRWRVNEDVSALTDQVDIVTGLPVNTNSGRHSGCRPRFGADGYLWIGTGDVADGTNPQDPKSLGGKILRVDRDGQPAPGNLADPFDPRIYSYGHRNVQGLAMFKTPRYGVYGFSVEHGPDRDDEVNLLRSGNMGWDPVPGYNESVPMTDTEKYPDAIEPVWRSGDSTIAPSGAAVITGKKWRSLEGRVALAVLKDQQVRLLEFDSNAALTSQKALFEGDFGRIRSVVMGPNDTMYLTTDSGDGQDRIIRITPQ